MKPNATGHNATGYKTMGCQSPPSDDAGMLYVDPKWRAMFVANGLRTLDDIFALEGVVRYDKAGLPEWRTRLAIDLDAPGTQGVSGTPGGANVRFYVKRFNDPPSKAQRQRRFAGHSRRTTAGVERYWIDALRAEGIAVPQVAAFGEEWDGKRERRSALVLVEVPGQSLERWALERLRIVPGVSVPHPSAALKDGAPAVSVPVPVPAPVPAPAPAPASVPAPASECWTLDCIGRVSLGMVEALADFIARFHGAGFVHRDLYLSHVFMHGGLGADPEFTLIDLQRVMRDPLRKTRWVCRDLAQLDYSTPKSVAGLRERVRFMKRYLGGESLRVPRVRSMLRRIARKSAQIAAHDARRQRRHGAPTS